MRIAIIDCDFNEGVSIMPNPWVMKLSSYYKQQENDVSLVARVDKPDRFDVIIIAKESPTAYLPPVSLLIHEKTRLIGKAFTRQPRYWRIPVQVYQARPDYNLYKFDFPSEITEASFISLTHKGKLLKTQKQTRVDLELSVNIIIDKGLWESEDLASVLDELAKYNKVIFLEPVDVNKLSNSILIEKFVKIRLFKRPISLKNISSVEQLEDTLQAIKTINKRKIVSFEKIKFITMNKELSAEDAVSRYYECIEAAAIANKHSAKIEYLVPKVEMFTYANIFEPFLKYRNHSKSFFSYLIEREFYKPADTIMNDARTWENPTVASIWAIYFKNKQAFENGFIVWGGRPDQARVRLDEGETEKFYDKYIL